MIIVFSTTIYPSIKFPTPRIRSLPSSSQFPHRPIKPFHFLTTSKQLRVSEAEMLSVAVAHFNQEPGTRGSLKMRPAAPHCAPIWLPGGLGPCCSSFIRLSVRNCRWTRTKTRKEEEMRAGERSVGGMADFFCELSTLMLEGVSASEQMKRNGWWLVKTSGEQQTGFVCRV